MRKSIAEALLAHKRAGNTIAVWVWERNCMRLSPADEIDVPEPSTRDKQIP
jgi:hypothetical protein